MGEEIRAFNNLRWYRATGDAPNSLIGLNGYGPNMNIARDPRFGRTRQECQHFLSGSLLWGGGSFGLFLMLADSSVRWSIVQ
jgi:hypothetical protein